jgi:3',5'-cyclic-AMP phosphodiesterase
MPIHLSPVSRREFLTRSIAAAAGLMVVPGLPAAAKRTDPNSWALLTDTHIAADPAQTGRGINMADHLVKTCSEVLALPQAPAGVIVHGDCAFSNGRPGDYEHLLELLKPLQKARLPIHLALGNHDHRGNFLKTVRPRNASPVVDKYASLVRAERVNFFILDSLNEIASNPGLIGAKQLQWLTENLDRHKRKPAIVVVHHNANRMSDFEELVRIMDSRMHVKAMFHGHVHNWRLRETEAGVHMVNLLPVSYPSQPGGATGWVHAHFTNEGVRLKVACRNKEDELHGSIHELRWRAG